MKVQCFVNKANGRSFVCTNDNELSVHDLLSSVTSSHSAFRDDLIKFGVDTFEAVMLEECDSFNELELAKRKWIALLASDITSHGYNAA